MRKWWIAGVVAAAILLVAGTIALDARRDARSADETASRSSESSGSVVTSSTAGKGSSSSAGSSGSKTPVRPTPGTPTTGPGGKAPSGGTAPANSPAQPVTEKVALKPVTQPPSATVAMIDPSKAEAGSTYKIEFVPYGTGPGAPGSSLVIRIDKSTAAAGVKKVFDFNGRNALVSVGALKDKSIIETGGRFTGTLTMRERGGLLVPELTDAARAKS